MAKSSTEAIRTVGCLSSSNPWRRSSSLVLRASSTITSRVRSSTLSRRPRQQTSQRKPYQLTTMLCLKTPSPWGQHHLQMPKATARMIMLITRQMAPRCSGPMPSCRCRNSAAASQLRTTRMRIETRSFLSCSKVLSLTSISMLICPKRPQTP